MSNIISEPDLKMTRTDEAKILHFEILKNGEDAAKAMVSFAKNLKTMRDKRLYTELGYDSFEGYTVKAVGLKKSQAYDYISALERLGENELESTASIGIGITKIKLLSAFNPIERAEFIENNDVVEMSTRELKEKISQLTKQGEQLSFDLETERNKVNSNEVEIERLEKEKFELKKKLHELENRPHDVAVRELTDEEKDEIIRSAVQKESEHLNEKIKKLTLEMQNDKSRHKAESDRLKAENKKAAENAVEEYKKQNAELVSEIEEIKKRSQQLESQIKANSSPEITRFSFFFEEMKETTGKLLEALELISDETVKAKLKANLLKYADALKSSIIQIAGS